MKPRIQDKFIFVVSLLVLMSIYTNAHARRGIEIMKDPAEFYYTDQTKITKAQATKLVREAISVSSRPRWIQRKGRGGAIRAEAERGRLFASVDIVIDDEGIKIYYVDSERMRYRERRDKKYIRDIYNKWVKSLGKEINKSIKSKYKIQLVSKKKRDLFKGIASGKNLVVIAVRALPDYRPVRNGPKWSAQIGESVAEALGKKYAAKYIFSVLEWNRETLNYVKSGYKASYNKMACDANESQGVITLGVVIDSTDTDGSGASEEIVVTYFNCDTEQLLVKTVQGDYKTTDAFNLQSASIFHVNKLLSEAGF